VVGVIQRPLEDVHERRVVAEECGAALDETAWNEAISAWFFRPEMQGRPVYLSVDEETLAEIADANGWALEKPAEDFITAVRRGVDRDPTDPLYRWGPECHRISTWWRAERPRPTPPFLSLLSAAVLAATQMGSSASGHGYNRTFRKILGLPDSGESVPRYEDHVPMLWRWLGKWLAEDHRGRLGLPTAAPGSRANIGWAISQALLRGVDRSRLTEFFVDIGAQPGQAIEPQELLSRLIEWHRAGGPIRPRVIELVAKDDLRDQVADIIASELKRWDGAVRDTRGVRVLRLVLRLDARRGAWNTAIAAPTAFEKVSLSLQGEEIEVGGDVAFALTPIPVDASLLIDGVSCMAAPVRLAYRPRRIVPLVPNDDLGGFVSVERAALREVHFVVVHDSVNSEFTAFIRQRSPKARLATNVPVLPGWRAYRDVFLEDTRTSGVPDILLALVPRATELPSLTGGLRIVAGKEIYLVEGAPNLVVPGLRDHDLEVMIDNEAIAQVGRDGEVIDLNALRLATGEHRISVGSSHFQFQLLERLRETSSNDVLAHHLYLDGSGVISGGPVAQLSYDAPIAVSGAAVYVGTEAPATLTNHPPIMVKGQADRYYLLDNAGRVVEATPTMPAWASEAGLLDNAFELDALLPTAQFQPAWVLRRLWDRWTVRLLMEATEVAWSVRTDELGVLLRELQGVKIEYEPVDAADVWHLYTGETQ
jgi:hypothetical protein